MKQKQFLSPDRVIRLFIIAIAGSVIFEVPYLRFLYYDTLLEAVGLTNTQFGNTMSVFGIVSMFVYFPGGLIADRFSTKKLLTFSLLGVGGTGFWFSFYPRYEIQLIIYALWAIFISFTFWSAMNKSIRCSGTSEEQGRLFGLIEGGRGLIPMIYGFIVLSVFNSLGANIIGVTIVIRIYSSLCLVAAVLTWLYLSKNEEIKEDKTSEVVSEKRSVIKDTVTVLRYPAVWLIALIIFSSYVCYSAQSYLSPYLSEIFLATPTLVAALGLVRTYGLAIGGGPLGGIASDKIKSTTKVLNISFMAILFAVILFLIIPGNPNFLWAVTVAMLIMGFFIFVTRGIYFATIDEVSIPRELSGAAIGFVSFIGFIPDAFIYTLFGSWMDKYPGIPGYKIMFIFLAVFTAIGFIATIILLSLIKKNKKGA